MSYTLKYRYFFKTMEGDDCRVDFSFKEAPNEGITIINPGMPPFILREFNSDQDFFKPLRPFLAEMTILSDMVTIEDFIHPEDDGVKVEFLINNIIFWKGWLLQDDFQEAWTDNDHYIVLRATDALGQIGSQSPSLREGQFTMLEFIDDALVNTTIGGGVFFPDSRVFINNLFYEGMNDRTDGAFNSLAQVTTEGKTFQGDNKAVVLEKILKAWSMCLFQHRGRWWFVRLEELMNNLSLKGIEEDFLGNQAFTDDLTVNVGVDEDIYPIAPEMLRSIRRPFKRTKINFFYRFPDEIICNQSFLRGSIIVPTNNYTIDCWTLRAGLAGSTNPATASAYRVEVTDIDGNITDNYIVIDVPALAGAHVLESSPVYLNLSDSIEIGFDVRFPLQGVGPDNKLAINVSVEAAGGIVYYLDSDGNWVTSVGFAGGLTYINIPYAAGESLEDWKSVNVRSKQLPAPGILKIWFYGSGIALSARRTEFKSLEFKIREASKQPGVIGDYDQYEQELNITQSYEEECFVDDSNNRAHKGALFFNNDLTGDNWYRMDYPAERLTFKRHKAIAHAYLNKRYRNKLEVTMFGLKAPDGYPVWLQHRIVFVDDAPNKQFMITNLSEVDFANSTWKANLIEVWDSEDSADIDGHSFGNIYERDV